MLKFFLKVILLFVIVLLLSMVVRSFVPTFFAGKVIYNKSQIWEKNKDKYHALFLGTSRINHGVKPKIFDKVYKNNSKKKSMKSFNFGISGASSGEVFFVLDNLLSEKPDKLRFVVMELCSIETSIGDKFCVENLHTNRNKYWLTRKTNSFVQSNVRGFQGKVSSKRLWASRKNYFVNWFENIFNIGMLTSAAELSLEGIPPERGVGRAKDGYNNIEAGLERGAKRARKGFLKSKEKLNDTKRKKSLQYFTEKNQSLPTNEPYLEKLKELIRDYKERGIHLLIVAPPLMSPSSYAELSPVFFSLPKAHRLNFADGKDHSALYDDDNVWDGNHVNNSGAEEFSREMAREIAKRGL